MKTVTAVFLIGIFVGTVKAQEFSAAAYEEFLAPRRNMILPSSVRSQYYNLSNDSGSCAYPQVATDSMGNVHFVWVDNSTGRSEVYYAVYGSRTPERVMINLGSISGGSDSCNHPRIAVDSSGSTVYAVWEQLISSGKLAVVCASFSNPVVAVNSSIRIDTLSLGISNSCYQPDIAIVQGAPFVCWASDKGSGALPLYGGELYFTQLNTQTRNWIAPVAVADSIAVDVATDSRGIYYFWGRVTSAFDGTVFWEDNHGMNAHKNLMVVGPLQNHLVSSSGWLPLMKGMEIARYGTAGNEKAYILYHGDGTTCNCDEPLGYCTFDGNSWANQTTIAYSALESIRWGGFGLAAVNDTDVVVIYEKTQWNDSLLTVRYDGTRWNAVKILPNVAGFSDPSIATTSDGNLWLAFCGSSGGGNTDIFVYGIPLTSVHGSSSGTVPANFYLAQNYPNPFNPITTISYQLSGVSFVSLKVYNLLGQEVATLVNEKQTPGTYVVQFDGSKLASGLYFYRFTTPDFTQLRKMILVK